ncbi:MAG: MBL fold metallo-hydrolase [Euryarchaeota archaeon]|nr:MBL fold metallo-hydrolase [Euryarchaeota archaeon]
MNNVELEFWGVRGSVPSPGPKTAKYGGNTSCISITANNKILILDAGTGIRNLGTSLLSKPELEIFVIITHSHWDHIQGFPFFTPIYQPNRPVHMFPTIHKKNVVLSSLIDQMDGAHFPVTPDQVPSNFNFITEDPLDFLKNNGFHIELVPMNHPGGAFGYKVTVNSTTICYFTDNEIDPPYQKSIELDELTKKCDQVDVLIHDAQYIEDDMPLKHGWGHSLINQVTQLGINANVKKLIYYHHDPERDDESLDNQAKKVAEDIKKSDSNVETYFAKEGLKINL